MRVLVMIAAHNEEENIANVVTELVRVTHNIDYLVINDGSTDRTEEICRENGFHYVNLPVNLGIGGAIQTGYRYAYDHGYDIAVQLDGDGQHDPGYLADVIRPVAEGAADYVIGSRFLHAAGNTVKKKVQAGRKDAESISQTEIAGKPAAGADASKDQGKENVISVHAGDEGFQSTGARRTGIRFLSGLIHLMCGRKIYDVTSGFRAVGRRSIEEFAANYPADYPEPEAIIDAVLRGERVMEVPVKMREREHGTSSINMRRSVYYMIKVSLDIIVCRISYGIRRDPNVRRHRVR